MITGQSVAASTVHPHYYTLNISGVPDAVLEGARGTIAEGKPFMIGEGKGMGPGEAQLLGAVIKCWSIHGYYPIGE